MTINIEYEAEEKLDLDYEKIITDVVNEAVDYEKCPYEAEVNVTIVDSESIHEINKEYRNIDSPTDVLSFPGVNYVTPSDFDAIEDELENNAEDYFNPDTGELLLGDIVLCVQKIKEQADKYGHSEKRELAFLTAHSMMHLFGYDHMEEDEAKVMEAKQREVLARRFGLLGYEAATLEDVGREIGLTRERVRQIQVEGLRRLREILQTQGLNIEALFRE